MSADGAWTIHPGQGLGRLEFGMSAAQVDALSDVYGSVSGRGSDKASDTLLGETLAMFGGAMRPEEKRLLTTSPSRSKGSPSSRATTGCGHWTRPIRASGSER